jgi:hypothetical protein
MHHMDVELAQQHAEEDVATVLGGPAYLEFVWLCILWFLGTRKILDTQSNRFRGFVSKIVSNTQLRGATPLCHS